MKSFCKEHYKTGIWILLGLLLFFAVTGFSTIKDYDYFFHYAAGESIFETASIPTTAIGSWWGMQQNLSWISHEWLFAVLIYQIASFGGETLVCLMPMFTMIFIIVGVLISQRNRLSKCIPLTIILLFSLIYYLESGYSPRPHLFAYIFTFLLYLILNRDIEKEDWSIYLLIPLTILWVNLHGGSYIMLFVMAIMSTVWKSFKYCPESRGIMYIKSPANKRRWIVILICIICVGVNAHGLDMYMYPFSNLGDDLMQRVIMEWSAPDLKKTQYLLFYIVVLINIIQFIFAKKKIRLFDLCYWLGFLYLSFRSMRFIPQFMIVAFLIGLRYPFHLPELKFEKIRLSMSVTLFFLVAIFAIFNISTELDTINKQQGIRFDEKLLPKQNIIDKIKEVNPQRLYNNYEIGGYLLFNNIDTFIDGRADIFSKSNLSDYMQIHKFSPGALATMKKYNFDYFLVNESMPITEYLKSNNAQFKLIEENEGFYFFQNLSFENKL